MLTERTLELSPQVESSSAARAVALDWAQGREEELTFALELVVSELVTNAVRHGSGPITLTLSEMASGVRVGVHDHGLGMPVAGRPGPRSPGGRGLGVIDRLSSAWGVEPAHSNGGKTVWAIVTQTHER